MIDWEDAFVAMSTLLGEPLDAVRGAADRDLARALQDPDKRKRAKTLANALASIALGIEHVTLTEIR
ncbi:MAG: hypothetical protein ACRELY_22075 [Polyangiaceae bacterium]